MAVTRQPVDNVYVIAHVPAATPVITPVVGLMVSVAGQPLLQLPPVVAFVAVVVEPTQVARLPPIVAGNGLTVSVTELEQPVVSVHIIVTVPAEIPVTIPEDEPTVAMAVLLLDQVPPAGLLVSVVVEPSHTAGAAGLITGNGYTVTMPVIRQPVGAVYVTVHVEPEALPATPVTTPVEEPMDNIAGQALLHVPPPTAFVSDVVDKTQTLIVPPIAGGFGLTVAIAVVMQPVSVDVNVMIDVPTAAPDITPFPPVVNIGVTVGVPLTHVPPPEVALLKVEVVPRHNDKLPDIAAGNGLTVIVAVVEQPEPKA
jgi:hypothetical protein